MDTQPEVVLSRMLEGAWITQIARTAAVLNVFDHLADGPLSAVEIAARSAADPDAMYRLLRAAASVEFLSHEGERRFANTALGHLLRMDTPGSLRPIALMVASHGHWAPWELLPDAIRTGSEQVHTTLGTNFFDYLKHTPAEATNFVNVMDTMTAMAIADAVSLIDTKDVHTVVDVGGSSGSLIHALMRENPQLHGTVLDLPSVTPAAEKSAAEAGLSDRHSVVSGDFFDVMPAADLYVIKNVLHNWDDQSCKKILSNCRRAVQPGGHAVVIEPLVPDLGVRSLVTLMDINMLLVTTGRERELGEFEPLFATTGWRLTSVHSTGSPSSLMTLEPV